ncbi:MAG: DUF3502 domain-containing protein [Anaerolineae bacterium]|nr:DUF3502 domain-containing protein [Anaerolineae bacterium]
MTATTEEYKDMVYGLLDFEKILPEYIDRVKKAGADKVIAELQRQIDEWKASK